MCFIDHCERDGVAAVVADDPLRLAGRAGRVEDVERVGGLDGDACRRLGAGERVLPVEIATGIELASSIGRCRTMQRSGFDSTIVDRRVEKRLVGDDAPGLDPARGGDDDLRLRVLDPARELVRGEAAEDDGMDRADARAREHRDDRFRDHRHVDDHPVAALDSLRD